MITALIYLGASVVVLIALSTLYIVEDARGQRVMLSGARAWLDRTFTYIFSSIYTFFLRIWQLALRFVLHYGVYHMLGAAVTYLINLERRLETVIRKHRHVANGEKRERNHLDEIADHKESIALSDEEKQRLRDE